MFPAGGQNGCRGAPDPLLAYGAEFDVGIRQEQVCSRPPLAHPLHRPRLTASHAAQILRSERRPVPWPISTFPGSPSISSARDARVGVVLVCCVLVATCSSRRCVVCPCACAVLTSGELVRVHLSSQICNLVSEITFVSHVHRVNFCTVAMRQASGRPRRASFPLREISRPPRADRFRIGARHRTEAKVSDARLRVGQEKSHLDQ